VRIFREWHDVDSGFDGAVVTTSEELLAASKGKLGRMHDGSIFVVMPVELARSCYDLQDFAEPA
jgi:hypothetical protein